MANQRFDFSKFQRRWEQEKKQLPVIVAREAENHFKEGFRLGGFLDDVIQKWLPRKKPDAGRGILVKSGRLRRSIRAVPGYDFSEIKIASDVPYARRHNEGLDGMPKRQFLGPSKMLHRKIAGFAVEAIKRVFS